MLAYAWSLDAIELAVGLLACIILSGALYYCHSHWFWPLMLTPSASWIFSFPTFCSSIIKKKGSTRSTTHASSRFHSFPSFDSNIEKKTPLPSRRLPIISENGARIGGVSGLSPRLADSIYMYIEFIDTQSAEFLRFAYDLNVSFSGWITCRKGMVQVLVVSRSIGFFSLFWRDSSKVLLNSVMILRIVESLPSSLLFLSKSWASLPYKKWIATN